MCSLLNSTTCRIPSCQSDRFSLVSSLMETGCLACGGWQTATASVKYPGLPLIDFSTIAAGTSNGRIDFIVSGGSIVFDSQGSVSLGHTILTNSGPTVTYVAAGTTAPFELVSPSVADAVVGLRAHEKASLQHCS
jgi:hypothetical protein